MEKNWPRYEEARKLRQSGLTLRAVGDALGISATRVTNMLRDLERKETREARQALRTDHPVPPA